MKRKAFTLIELLVVVAVVALLVAILMPQLAAAKSAARNAICKANLRHLGAAFESAANEPSIQSREQERYGAPQVAKKRYPEPERFPNVPFNVVPEEETFVCPEDDIGNWSVETSR